MIPIFVPNLHKKAKKYLSNCIDTNWISSQGSYILKFEKELAKYNKVKYCVVTSSCTTALHLAIKSLNIGKGHEVICPDLTFLAPANMIVQSGAKLKLIDINSETLAIDHNKIEKKITKNTKAIMVVHQFGHSADMDPIMKIARKYNLKVIEDNAESLGGKYKGKKLGTIGDVATLSFYANKIITCGEGGAVITNDPDINKALRLLRLHGRTQIDSNQNHESYHQSDMVILGWKYNMDNIHAAMLLPQLDGIELRWNTRLNISNRYTEALAALSDLRLPAVVPNSKHALHLYPIRIARGQRDTVISKLMKQGISTTVNFRPVHLLSFFSRTLKHSPGDFPIAEEIGSSTISLPFYPSIPNRDINAVIEALRSELS